MTQIQLRREQTITQMQEIMSLYSCITFAKCDDSTIKITKDQMDKNLLKHQLHCAFKNANDHPFTIAISHQFNFNQSNA